jgi:hypothetical protein
MLTVSLSGSTATHLYAAIGKQWGPARLDVEISPDSESGVTGVAVLYADEQRHYQVRIGKYQVEVVRVSPEGTSVLKWVKRPTDSFDFPSRPMPINPFGPPLKRRTYLPVSVTTKRKGLGLEITCKVGSQKLSIVDEHPVADTGAIGLLASGTDARFRNLAVGSTESQLDASTRYRLIVAGGSGGRVIRQDGFSSSAYTRSWASKFTETQWTMENEGLKATGAGASLALGEPWDDGELITTVAASPGDRLMIALRTADQRRATANTHQYELTLERTPTECRAELAASTGPGGLTRAIGSGTSVIGNAARVVIRVRLIGDSIRVWLFDWELIAARLAEVTIGTSAAAMHRIPVIRQGSLEWRVLAGTPVLREVQVREAALLSYAFTTSAAESFDTLLDALAAEADKEPLSATANSAQMIDAMRSVTTTQRALANAAINLHRTQAYFAMKRADRESVETHRQNLVSARSQHDDAVGDLLLHFGIAPLTVPGRASIRRLELASGGLVGYLLQSPESLNPQMIPGSGDRGLPFVGRTVFELVAEDGESLNTQWISSADGTSVVVFRIADGGLPSDNSGEDELETVIGDTFASGLQVWYRRDHGDDHDGIEDHLLDRPYQLSRSSRDPVERLLVLP